MSALKKADNVAIDRKLIKVKGLNVGGYGGGVGGPSPPKPARDAYRAPPRLNPPTPPRNFVSCKLFYKVASGCA